MGRSGRYKEMEEREEDTEKKKEKDMKRKRKITICFNSTFQSVPHTNKTPRSVIIVVR